MLKVLKLTILLCLAGLVNCPADTFTHRQTGEVLHGYATQKTINDKRVIYTVEKGIQQMNLAFYDIHRDSTGRNDKVIIISITEDILLQIEAEAFEKAIVEASNKGPLFILLEIDTPGGRADLAQQMCAAITKTDNCPVIAFVKGGKYGGALSAGAAIALACDKIYMAQNTVIGAATIITLTDSGPTDIKKVLGETVGEKIRSAWRNSLASLAQKNNRPALLAKAMENKDMEVVEVQENGNRIFIEPIDKKPAQAVVKTWSKKGSLLTLTAADAAQCNMADKVVGSQAELLADLGAAGTKLLHNTDTQKAREKFQLVMRRFKKIHSSVDYRCKQLRRATTKPEKLRIARGIKTDYSTLVRLAKHFPDLENTLGINVQALEEQLNSLDAQFKQARTGR